VRANENSAECYNLHGVALKSLKQYEQAVSEFKKALDVDSGLFDALYKLRMTYAECMRNRTPASRSSRPVTTCRNRGYRWGKDGSAFGFLRAASDKLYALSGRSSIASASPAATRRPNG